MVDAWEGGSARVSRDAVTPTIVVMKTTLAHFLGTVDMVLAVIGQAAAWLNRSRVDCGQVLGRESHT